MKFTVKDLMQAELLQGAGLLGGEAGLDREIRSGTIIEAPDIVKFISGGEVLLTGLYAFQGCSTEQFQAYIYELLRKDVSAIIVKRGRRVAFAGEKISFLTDFADRYGIAVVEIPFEISFRDILSLIMERLFNREVTRLKYFKTVHDNFAALPFSAAKTQEDGTRQILKLLSQMTGNGAALFNQSLECLAATDGELGELELSGKAERVDPGLYSEGIYMKQKNGRGKRYLGRGQCIVCFRIMLDMRLYLAVTETQKAVDEMDYIAIENAVTALRYEFFRQYSLEELERRYENDLTSSLLKGTIRTVEELRRNRNIGFLKLPVDASCRVIVFRMEGISEGIFEESSERLSEAENGGMDREGMQGRKSGRRGGPDICPAPHSRPGSCAADRRGALRMCREGRERCLESLAEIIRRQFPGAVLNREAEEFAAILPVDQKKSQKEQRQEIREAAERIRRRVSERYRGLGVRAGVGKTVDSMVRLYESFQEAKDALLFMDVALGQPQEEPCVMFFSELGVFNLLCQIREPEELMKYVPESLQKLYQYRRPQREDLIITLKTYLEHNRNLTKTAQELYIHYKTAAYRLKKIMDITGMDFENSSEILAVRIGLVVYKMIESREKA